jgi:hypothetical protein
VKGESRNLIDYRRLSRRSLPSLLRYKFLHEYGYDKGAVVVQAIVEDICKVVRNYYARPGDLEPGQLVYHAPAVTERGGRGKTMAKTKLVPVRLTIVADEDHPGHPGPPPGRRAPRDTGPPPDPRGLRPGRRAVVRGRGPPRRLLDGSRHLQRLRLAAYPAPPPAVMACVPRRPPDRRLGDFDPAVDGGPVTSPTRLFPQQKVATTVPVPACPGLG